jgi:dUTP pyrophosphatase
MSNDDILKFFENEEFSDENMNNMFKNFGLDLKSLEKEFDSYHPTKEVKYEVLSEDTIEPGYNYPSDSGFDLYSIIDDEVEPFGRLLIPTGLKFNIPDGTEIQIRPKSGLALKLGLTVLNTPGTIDSGYNGEIKVIVFNTTKEKIKISKGMKIAQAVLCPVINGDWVTLTKVDSVDEKDRGEEGFGSTGIFK